MLIPREFCSFPAINDCVKTFLRNVICWFDNATCRDKAIGKALTKRRCRLFPKPLRA